MKSDLEQLAELMKLSLQRDTVVLFFVPRDKTKKIAETLKCMSVWGRYGITPIAVPDDIYVQTIPPGSDFIISKEPRES